MCVNEEWGGATYLILGQHIDMCVQALGGAHKAIGLTFCKGYCITQLLPIPLQTHEAWLAYTDGTV